MASENKGNGNLKEAIRCVDAMQSTHMDSYGYKGNTQKLASMKTRKNAGDTATKPK